MSLSIDTIKVRLTFIEGILGTQSTDKNIYENYILSKVPENMNVNADEEKAALPEAGSGDGTAVLSTVFPRTPDGAPMFWDYQIKGFFKDACAALARASGTKSKAMKAYKKIIDGTIFVSPRQIPINFSGKIASCERSLRASTPQGERIALTSSEEIGAGASAEFETNLLNPEHEEAVREWLGYGCLRGLGQWRNSGKGRFAVEYLD
jgi:hypothetical protein